MQMRVAVIQMDIQLGDPAANRARVAQRVREAAQGADLVVLPELWTTGYVLPDLAGNLADRNGEPTGSFLSNLARDCGVFLYGSAADQRGEKVYNHGTVYGPDGTLVAAYDKVHLVPMMKEDRYLTPGDRLTLADLKGIKAGLAICYDVRFPELFRTLTLAGAQLFLVSAEWPAKRVDHWRTLLMARAIENQAFVVACNRVGRALENVFAGRSMIIDPWGDILAEGSDDEEEILRATLDFDKVAECRKLIPSLRDRRPESYHVKA